MPEYRAYLIGSDGIFFKAILLICPDDEIAKQKAKQLVDGHNVELWQLDRNIAKFDHEPEPALRPRLFRSRLNQGEAS